MSPYVVARLHHLGRFGSPGSFMKEVPSTAFDSLIPLIDWIIGTETSPVIVQCDTGVLT
jgi:hypothetical protein